MGNFNRDRGGRSNDRRGGGNNFGRRDHGRGGFNRDRGGNRPSMHQAICDDCGKECEVPFKPSGDKPIYCSDCFSKRGGGAPRQNKFGGDRGPKPSFTDRPAGPGNQDSKEIIKGIKTLNYKLDELLKLLGHDKNIAPVPQAEKIAKLETIIPVKIDKKKNTSDKKVVKKKVVKKKK